MGRNFQGGVEMLHRFFAVTVNGSLYEVSDEKEENGWPVVTKLNGPENPDMPIGNRLKNGQFVGIGQTSVCLFRFHPSSGRRFEGMNMVNWGGSTSGPVGLFLDRQAAEACVAAGEFEHLSDKYREQTIAVLRQIGPEHEVFEIGERLKRHYGLRFDADGRSNMRQGFFVTEFKVPVRIDPEDFVKQFMLRFPDGKVEKRAVFDGETIFDGEIPLAREGEWKLFWEDFCHRHEKQSIYGPSRFDGDR